MGREQEKSGRRDCNKKIKVFLTILCKIYKVRYLKVAKVTFFFIISPREKLSPDILLYINV